MSKNMCLIYRNTKTITEYRSNLSHSIQLSFCRGLITKIRVSSSCTAAKSYTNRATVTVVGMRQSFRKIFCRDKDSSIFINIDMIVIKFRIIRSSSPMKIYLYRSTISLSFIPKTFFSFTYFLCKFFKRNFSHNISISFLILYSYVKINC